MATVYIKTFGCQMNEHDSRKMQLMLGELGYTAVHNADQADLILFNTCTIREKAYAKAMSDIGRAAAHKIRRPGVRVGVCGCAAQQAKEHLAQRFPHVDFIVGPDQIHELPRMLQTASAATQVAVDLINDPYDYQFLEQVPQEHIEHGQAFVTIMKGCNYSCSYCIVPSVRGKEVCRPADDIVDEVARLVQHGVQEVTLLGQTVNAYRDPRPGLANSRLSDGIGFGGLIRRIAAETTISRIRFTSPHPLQVMDDLIAAYRDVSQLCSHMHLPLQSGSDSMLRRMRRGYTRERYLHIVQQLREARPGISIGTDIIVGFPGETEQEFNDTLSLVEEIGFDFMYAFAYSSRPGTHASEHLEDNIAIEEKQRRLNLLLDVQRAIALRHSELQVGKVCSVLVTGTDRIHSTRLSGRTDDFRIVNFSGSLSLIGKIVPVRILSANAYALEGEAVDATANENPVARLALPIYSAAHHG